MSTSIYTVANDRFFVGLLGLVSSVRVNGHDGPIVVVDSGLTQHQIEVLSEHITCVPAPRELPSHYLKAVGPLTHPDDVMLFVDSDMLCVRPLDDIVERARGGALVAFEDLGRAGFSDNLWSQWEDRLALGGLEPGTYVNGGFVAASREIGTAFFADFKGAIERIDPDETYIDAPDIDTRLPFTYACQDVINAVLASAPFRPRVDVLPYRGAPHAPFPGVRVDGPLTCVDDVGQRPLHPSSHSSEALARATSGEPVHDPPRQLRPPPGGSGCRREHASAVPEVRATRRHDPGRSIGTRPCQSTGAWEARASGHGLRSSRRSSKFVARPDARPA